MANMSSSNPRQTTVFVLDELFRLTGELVELTKSVSNEEFQGQETSVSAGPHEVVAPFQRLSDVEITIPSTPLSQSSQPSRPIDEATLLMVFSCHTRVTEMYAAIFEKTHVCIERQLPPRTDSNWAVILPRLQMGSIATPPRRVDARAPLASKADASLYILMFAMLSGQLWEQVADAMRGLRENVKRMGDVEGGLVTARTWDAVMGRIEGMVSTIEETKRLLQR